MRSDDDEDIERVVENIGDDDDDDSYILEILREVSVTHLSGHTLRLDCAPSADVWDVMDAAFSSELKEMKPLLRLAWVKRGEVPTLAHLVDLNTAQFSPVKDYSCSYSDFHVVALLHLSYGSYNPPVPVLVTGQTTLSSVLMQFLVQYRRLEAGGVGDWYRKNVGHTQMRRVRLFHDEARKMEVPQQSLSCAFLLLWAVQGFSPVLHVSVLSDDSDEVVDEDRDEVCNRTAVRRPFISVSR